MPKSQFQQTSFASGELSPLLLGRTDLDQYYKGVQQGEGVVIVPQGGVKRRPGTQFIARILQGLTRYTPLPTVVANATDPNNINDGNDNTYTLTPDGLSAPFTIATYDLGASFSAQTFLDVRNCSLFQSGELPQKTANITIEWSTNNTNWTVAATFEIDNQTERNFRLSTSTLVKRYWRLRTDLPAPSGYKVKIAEFVFNTEIGSSSPVGNYKLFGWEYAADKSYLTVLTNLSLRVYRVPHAGSTDTVYVGDVPLPYLSADIPEVKVCQTEGVMLMFHEDYPPQRIVFDGLDTVNSFAVDAIPFINVPQFDYNDSVSPVPVAAIQTFQSSDLATGQRYKVTAQGVTSKDITHGGNGDGGSAIGLDRMATSAFNLQKNLQEMPVFGFTGITVTPVGGSDIDFIINMADESAGDYDLFTAFVTSGNVADVIPMSITQDGSPRTEDVWSAARGYPKQGVFHEGRLWLGGSKSKPQSIFASRAGNYYDFFGEEGEDDEGIFVTIDSRSLTDIVDINPDRGLQVFCKGAEFLVKGQTPSNIEVVSQTQHGSFNLEAQSFDGATLFVDKNGNTLRQFLFNFGEDAYTSADLSVLSSQLINQPVAMATLSGTTTEDANWVFLVNADGAGAVLNTMRSQDINGFSRWTPHTGAAGNNFTRDCRIKTCATAGGYMYQITSRNTGAQTGSVDIEVWNFDHLLDSSEKITITNSGFVPLTQGSRLFGYSVQVLADGDVLAKREVTESGGEYGITITSGEMNGFTSRVLEVGLTFDVKVKTMPLNTNPGTRGGQNIMKRKKITNINLRVYQSAGIYIDGNAVPIRQFGDAQDTPLNTPFTPRTGIIEDKNGGNGWSTEVVPEITVPDGTPFHLQAIQYEVESS